jgi:hypothetical protein
VPRLLACVQGRRGGSGAAIDGAALREIATCAVTDRATLGQDETCKRNASRCLRGIGGPRADARDRHGSPAAFAFGTSSRKPKAIAVVGEDRRTAARVPSAGPSRHRIAQRKSITPSSAKSRKMAAPSSAVMLALAEMASVYQ